MKKKLLIGMIVVATMSMVACGEDNNNVNEVNGGKTQVENTNKDSSEGSKKDTVDDKTDNKTDDKDDKEIEKPEVEDTELEEVEVELKEAKNVTISKEKKEGHPDFATPWKKRDDKGILIEGRGEEAVEEGKGYLIYDNAGELSKVDIKVGSQNLSPNYVEWCEDDILVNMVNSTGRVLTGSKLYKIDTDNFKVYDVYSAKDNEEIVEASLVSDDIINIKISIVNDNGIKKAIEKNIKIK